LKAKILIVEDQFIEANNLQMILERAAYKVCSIARSVPIAQEIIRKEHPDMVLLDIYLQGNQTGIELAKELREQNIAFVYISANSNRYILDAAKSTRPYGFLVKPFREYDVLVMLDVAWYLHQYNQEANNKKNTLLNSSKSALQTNEIKNIIGNCQNMLAILESINVLSSSDISVLVLGESGTGKELVARSIHRSSSRKDKPFVVVNCGALPANLIESELFGHEKGSFTGAINKRIGKFEQADKGTIFLDEIGELPLDLQVKFLRVLQEKEIEPVGGRSKKINVRVIAATNRNLEDEIAAGRFRIDLYYRLNVFPVLLPPLRERKGDILSLANHFLTFYANKEGKTITGFSENVIKEMLNYSWPGNVRELENIIERNILLTVGPVIDSLVLPKDQRNDPIREEAKRVKTMEENERDHIIAVLTKCNWKLYGPGGAAETLAINGSTLSSRMKKLGIAKL
jgi:two-component system, NtrC family, response regulator HydG